MKLSKIALIGGAAVLALSGMGVAACSSTPAIPAVPGPDSSTQNPDGGGPGDTDSGPGNTDSGPGTTTDSGPGTEAGPTCKIPKLHPNPAGAIFCGYDDAGSSFDCNSDSGTQECCLGGKLGAAFAPETCAAFGTACQNGTNAVAIECGQISDCTANGKVGAACCLQGVTGGPTVVAGCPATDLKQSGGTGITCEVAGGGADGGDAGGGGGVPACATGETQICSQDADCPTTHPTCVAMHWKLYNVGFCQ